MKMNAISKLGATLLPGKLSSIAAIFCAAL